MNIVLRGSQIAKKGFRNEKEEDILQPNGFWLLKKLIKILIGF